MKRLKYRMLAIALVSAVSFTPAAAATAYAHGHQGGHHGSSTVKYYYCNGHDAHTHDEGGVCPYADYYYCNGHDAHIHENGVCPYADADYYYCDGHDAHTHENGVCPYASSYLGKDTIKKVQEELKQCGYNCGKADGIIGSKTKKALRSFQKDNDLEENGVIDQATLKALGLSD